MCEEMTSITRHSLCSAHSYSFFILRKMFATILCVCVLHIATCSISKRGIISLNYHRRRFTPSTKQQSTQFSLATANASIPISKWSASSSYSQSVKTDWKHTVFMTFFFYSQQTANVRLVSLCVLCVCSSRWTKADVNIVRKYGALSLVNYETEFWNGLAFHKCTHIFRSPQHPRHPTSKRSNER